MEKIDTIITEWINEDGKKLVKNVEFANFSTALKFLNQVGEVAEKLKHHPDLYLYNYKFVSITLSTHDKGVLTEKDFELAQNIDLIPLL